MVALLGSFDAFAAPDKGLPPKPENYFNDYASLVSPQTARKLNSKLRSFEAASSNQVVVAIFPKLPENAVLEDFCTKTFEYWKIGQRGRDNGVGLFVFKTDRKLFIATGYGLEGALPDALCKRIISEQITPRFKTGDFDGGMEAGVDSILKATRGEYKGTGKITSKKDSPQWPIVLLLPLLFVFVFVKALRRGFRRRGGYDSPTYWGGPHSGGGGLSSGGFGGGFGGGGGRTGGGGAGGSW